MIGQIGLGESGGYLSTRVNYGDGRNAVEVQENGTVMPPQRPPLFKPQGD